MKFNLFIGKLIDLFFHSTASLVVAKCTGASLTFTSSNYVPSLVCVHPKYLNWSISSNTSIHPIGGWPWLDAVDEDFAFAGADFHAIISSCFSTLSVNCCSFTSLPLRRSISSANRKLQSGRPPTETDDNQ